MKFSSEQSSITLLYIQKKKRIPIQIRAFSRKSESLMRKKKRFSFSLSAKFNEDLAVVHRANACTHFYLLVFRSQNWFSQEN